MEVREDVTMLELGDFRWLTIAPPGKDSVAICLMAIPGPPMFDESTVAKISELTGMGYAGTVFLTTDDVYAEVEELKARGVEFVDEPEERP